VFCVSFFFFFFFFFFLFFFFFFLSDFTISIVLSLMLVVFVLVVSLLAVGARGSDNCTNATECTDGYFPCSDTTIGNLLLVVFYGCVLGVGAKFISDGAEGILDLWPNYGSVIGALLCKLEFLLCERGVVVSLV
jgi:hypothetical protein